MLVADSDQVLTVAAKTGTFYGQRMTAGRVYTVGSGYSESGAMDVQLDSVGNLVITLGGQQASHTNYETQAQVLVKARQTGTFYGQRMVKGKTYEIAGGPRGGGPLPGPPFGPDRTAPTTAAPTTARQAAGVRAGQADLGYLIGVVRFDAAGNIVLADGGGDGNGPFGGGSRMMVTGDIYAVAGTGAEGFSGDGGSALAATLDGPLGVAVDKNGNLLLIDSEFGSSYRIRIVADGTGTFYATRALFGAAGIAVQPVTGDLLIADSLSARVRSVSR